MEAVLSAGLANQSAAPIGVLVITTPELKEQHAAAASPHFAHFFGGAPATLNGLVVELGSVLKKYLDDDADPAIWVTVNQWWWEYPLPERFQSSLDKIFSSELTGETSREALFWYLYGVALHYARYTYNHETASAATKRTALDWLASTFSPLFSDDFEDLEYDGRPDPYSGYHVIDFAREVGGFGAYFDWLQEQARVRLGRSALVITTPELKDDAHEAADPAHLAPFFSASGGSLNGLLVEIRGFLKKYLDDPNEPSDLDGQLPLFKPFFIVLFLFASGLSSRHPTSADALSQYLYGVAMHYARYTYDHETASATSKQNAYVWLASIFSPIFENGMQERIGSDDLYSGYPVFNFTGPTLFGVYLDWLHAKPLRVSLRRSAAARVARIEDLFRTTLLDSYNEVTHRPGHEGFKAAQDEFEEAHERSSRR
jgi:hypothetical protein